MKENFKNNRRLSTKKGLLATIVLSILLTLTAALGSLPFTVSAEDISEVNRRACETALSALGEEIRAYGNADASSGKIVSQKTGVAINSYRQKILELQSDAATAQVSLTAQIELAYRQALAHGKATWVYQSRIYEYPLLASRSEFVSAYDRISTEIANAASGTSIADKPAAYAQKLNQTAFCELIRAENKPTDSLAVNALAEGAIEAIERLSSTLDSGAEYRTVYEKAISDMSIRRAKDNVTAELQRVHSIICPKADFSADKKVALFVYQLDEKKTVEEMNIVLKNTIFSLLDPLKTNKYTTQYIEALEAFIDSLTNAASSVESIPKLADELQGFNLEYSRAKAKGEISADISSRENSPSSELILIETDYNKENGIFDLCSSIEEIEFEVKRAKLRADWFMESKSVSAEISAIMSPHSPRSLLDKLSIEYVRFDNSISAVLFSTKNSESLIGAEFAKACEAAATIKDEARITKFKEDHKAVIEKQLANVTSKDTQALSNAITDAIALDEKLSKEISDVTSNLASKYRTALKKELSERQMPSSASHIWKKSLESLSAELDSLPDALPISDFYGSTQRISDRANSIAKIIEKHVEIISDKLYSAWSDQNKAMLSEAGLAATEVILEVNITPISWAERLEEALKEALLTLRRAECIGRLYAMASKTTDSGAFQIADEASKKLEKAITEGGIETIYAEAHFKLSRILQYEEVLQTTKELEKYIKSLKYLTDTQKEEFCEELSANITPYADKIKLSDSASTLSDAYSKAEEFLSGISSKADEENLKTARRTAKNQLSSAISQQKNALNSLVHISNDKKSTLEGNLNTIKLSTEEKINASKTVSELDKVMSESAEKLTLFGESLTAAELEACRFSIKEKYRALTDLKERYSVENYKSLSAIATASIDFLNKCNSIADMLSEKEAVLARLNAIPDLLDEKKTELLTSLDTLYESISSKNYLYSASAFALAEKTYKNAHQSISEVEKFEKLSLLDTLYTTAVSSLSSIKADRAETSDKLILSGNSTQSYPIGYSLSQSGYAAYITAEGKIPHGVNLKLSKLSTDKKQGALKKIIKGNGIFLSEGGELSKELKKQLKKAELLLGFKLESTLDFDGTAYKLTFLLPDSVSKDRIIGLVSISDNGSAEFYNFKIDGSLMTVTVDSPESFYLALTKNPLPLILTIALILLFLLASILLIYRYLKQRDIYTVHIRDESDVTALQVSNGSRAVDPFVRKSEANLEIFTNKDNAHIDNGDQEEKDESDTEVEDKNQEASQDSADPSSDDGSRIPLGTQIKKRFFDFQAKGSRRAEINLDILAAHFESGDNIDLDSMIAKGLLPPDTTFVKVLARGKISKPLTIAAQDFSTAAMRMILLAGGNATITEEKID